MTSNKLFAAERRMMEKRGGFQARTSMPAPVNDRQFQDAKKLLEAIDGLREEIRKSLQPKAAEAMPEFSVLQGQLYELRDSIEKTKQEIAAVRRPGEDNDRLTTAAMELDAIVAATEEATHGILDSTEEIDDRIHKVREKTSDPDTLILLDDIGGLTTKILEACNFQDISGQRIGKVVNIINYLEERIITMIDIWGAEEFAGIKVADEARDADAALLEGPQMAGAGVSQDDIDSMFD